MRFVVVLIGGLAVVYLGICIALFAVQRSMIYFPQAGGGGGVGEKLEVEGATLVVTSRRVEGELAVVYFGGECGGCDL